MTTGSVPRLVQGTRRVTLTFDNGPTPGVTEAVLAILECARLHCTFFVIGRKCAGPQGQDLIHAAHQAGHRVGNHTLTHTVAFGDRPEAAYARHEIEETQQLIGALAAPGKLFRPYGNSGLIGPHLLSRGALDHLLHANYTTVTWNSVPGDWKDVDGWVDRCIEQVLSQDWSVVVLHDIAQGCLARLPELLQRLEDVGVSFEQDFPDEVVVTRDGHLISCKPEYLAD